MSLTYVTQSYTPFQIFSVLKKLKIMARKVGRQRKQFVAGLDRMLALSREREPEERAAPISWPQEQRILELLQLAQEIFTWCLV